MVARRAEGKGAFLVDGSAHHLASSRFCDRNGLAGDHRFIDIAVAVDHLAVDRDAFSGPHLDDVT
jgi:hypothetical protein